VPADWDQLVIPGKEKNMPASLLDYARSRLGVSYLHAPPSHREEVFWEYLERHWASALAVLQTASVEADQRGRGDWLWEDLGSQVADHLLQIHAFRPLVNLVSRRLCGGNHLICHGPCFGSVYSHRIELPSDDELLLLHLEALKSIQS